VKRKSRATPPAGVLKTQRPRRRGRIARSEWDFSTVQARELAACIEWEVPRLVPAIVKGALALRERGQTDLSCVITQHLDFAEWPDLPFTELPPGRRWIFAVERLNDEGLPPDLAAAMDLELGNGTIPSDCLCLAQIERLLAYAKQNGSESALRVAREYLSDEHLKGGERNPLSLTLHFDLTRSNDSLCAAFRTLADGRRRANGITIAELRGGSNAIKRAQADLHHLAAARMLGVMEWEDAYLETLETLDGKPLYANRPEVWLRAAKAGRKLMSIWEKDFTTFKSAD
jgi:hypothetical protein